MASKFIKINDKYYNVAHIIYIGVSPWGGAWFVHTNTGNTISGLSNRIDTDLSVDELLEMVEG